MEVNMFAPIKNFSLFALVFIFLMSLLTLPVPSIIKPVNAQEQSICTKNLAEAEKKYNTGRFDEAIVLITECLGQRDISEEEKMKAYRLLGLSYIAKDFLDDARNAVRKLLYMVPSYEPDPVQDPPPFTRLIEEVKHEKPPSPEKPIPQAPRPEERKTVTPSDQKTEVSKQPETKKRAPDDLEKLVESEKKGGSKKWLYIGGGAVVAGGVVAAILLSGKDEGTQTEAASFPMPPGRP
jgi:outer membrane biosynthesis protein TonB